MVAAFAPDLDFASPPAPVVRRQSGLRVVGGRPPTVAPDCPTAAPRRRATPTQQHASAGHRHTAAVYRRRRIVAAGALAVVLIGAWWAVRTVGEGSGRALVPTRPIASRVWVVHAGDTLWGIALASGDKGDIRRVVDELAAEIHDQPLQVGERITLP